MKHSVSTEDLEQALQRIEKAGSQFFPEGYQVFIESVLAMLLKAEIERRGKAAE